MAVVAKPFDWASDGFTIESLATGDERDFGFLTAGLASEGFVVFGDVIAAELQAEHVVEPVIEPVVETPATEPVVDPATEAVAEPVGEAPEQAPDLLDAEPAPKKRGK